MNTKTKLATVIEAVVQDLARAADENSVIDQWGLSVAEIEEDLTPEQLQQSQDWLDSLIAGARLRFTEDDVTYYYEDGKYYSVYGDGGAYDGSNVIGEPEEISPEMMAVVLLGIHLDAGTLHVVGENNQQLEADSSQWHVLDDEKGSYSRGPIGNGADYGAFNGVFAYADDGSVIGMALNDNDKTQFTFYKDGKYNYATNINSVLLLAAKSGSPVSSDARREITRIAQDHQDLVEESAVTSLRFKPDQFNEVPVGATVSIPEKPGFELQAELQPDLDSEDPENYFTLDLYRIDVEANSKQGLDSMGGIDGRDVDYINQQLQAMLGEQGLEESGGNMTEREMLDALVAFVKEKGLRVPSPDYRQTKKYAPQWKILGNQYYYQLPGNGLIVAKMNDYSKKAEFNADGLPKPTWDDVARAKAEAAIANNFDSPDDFVKGKFYVVNEDEEVQGGPFNSRDEANTFIGSPSAQGFHSDWRIRTGVAMRKIYSESVIAATLLGEAKSGEEIALRNKNRDGQGILDAEGNEIPNSVVFSSGYGGAYSYSGRLVVYSINAITGEMTQVELGEDALPFLAQLA
jgi:hypothetical protein